jgi:hypothetical protein
MKRFHTDYCCGDESALVARDSEWSIIVNALRAAADHYNDIAGELMDVRPDLCSQMGRQALDALALADKIAEEVGV